MRARLTPPEDVATAKKMWENGAAYEDIAQTINRLPNTIRGWTYDPSWDKEKRKKAMMDKVDNKMEERAKINRERVAAARKIKKQMEGFDNDGTPYSEALKKCLSPEYGLYDYQREFILDKSRFKCVLKARQVGFSYIIGLCCVLGALKGRDQLVVSSSEDQSSIIHDHVLTHTEKLGIMPDNVDATDDSIQLGEAKIKFFGSNFRTIQGRAGDVWLDEFAWHMPDKQKKIWGAIAPSVTAVGGSISVISTPFVPDSFHWRLTENHNNEWPQFKRWRVTIHDAIDGGMVVPGGIDTLRSIFCADDWAMFFLCQYAEGTDALLNWNLLSSATTEVASIGCDYYNGGVDIGRTNHRFAVAIIGKVANKDLYVLKQWQVTKGLTFAKQEQEVLRWDSRMDVRRWCVDRTGLGMDIAERLTESLSPRCVGVHFDAKKKERMALKMLKLFEDKKIVIPNNADVMANLHSVKKIVSGMGVKYDATSDDSGHGDLFWAVAMAVDSMVNNYGGGRSRVELWS